MSVQSIKSNLFNVQDLKARYASKASQPNFKGNEVVNNATNPLNNFLNAQAAMNKTMVNFVKPVAKAEKVEDNAKVEAPVYKNNLRTMLQNGESKILAIVPRTFNAKDENGDEKITGNEQHGTLLNAIDRLDEVKAEGFNTFHILPIHPTGKEHAMGLAGSLYSPLDFLAIDPNLIDKNDKRTPEEQFKAFTDECHKRDIKVMLDLPSCSSLDLYKAQPELMAKERDGQAKTPQGWNDIRMFQPFADETKRELNPELVDLHKKYVDMCVDLGIDGIRADVARAKPTEFWDIIIPYSHSKDPEFGWLGETYTYEDASPQANMPYDRPEDSLRAGFDAYYGQYHIFHEWKGAKDLNEFVEENIEMSNRLPKGKSIIGSFTTHDDISPMFHGGTDYCNLTAGLQATLPMLNPYYVDGYQSGDYYVYGYDHEKSEESQTDCHEMVVHRGKLDIFNLSRKPGGKNPEIGKFMTESFKMRDKYQDLITKGSFIELNKENDKDDQVIAYARHKDGKTLLVIGNKNINRNVTATVKVPTMKEGQELKNLLPSYGGQSKYQAGEGEVKVDLGPSRIHVFEIDTPDIEKASDKVFKQNL
jgi:glycosidase